LPRRAAASVLLDYPEQGGHVGFAVGAPPGSLDWLPRRMIHFLQGENASSASGQGQMCEA
jgi:predicted alpha/beta-fold hydrolase